MLELEVIDGYQRVVSWDDGYQTCKLGSRIDGTNCVILARDQRVVSWDDGYQTCKLGSRIDGTNCVILASSEGGDLAVSPGQIL